MCATRLGSRCPRKVKIDVATSVDTNVLSYLLLNNDPGLADAAERALTRATREGAVLVSGPVMAELLAVGKWDGTELASRLTEAGIDIDDRWDLEIWTHAAAAFTRYMKTGHRAGSACPHCGTHQRLRCRCCHAELGWPKHVLSDFLIGGHALHYECSLLTHDAEPYRAFFPDLHVVPLLADAER